jgi:pyrimidine operon attenuation protein/uracil phosphoribosyltransferase
LDHSVLVGIHTRGVNLAQRISDNIRLNSGHEFIVNKLNPIPFRDDSKILDSNSVNTTILNNDINNKTVILIDDVLYTGRTVRASIQALSEYGRAKKIKIAVLVDRGHREIPIKPDYVGKNIPTAAEEKISVKFIEVDGIDRVDLLLPEGELSK